MAPDAVVRWYDQALGSMAPTLDLVRSEGLIYAVRCGARVPLPAFSRRARMARLAGKPIPKDRTCSSRTRHWSYAERQWVCGRCGSAWRFWVRRSLRGEVQETTARADASERRLQRLVDVGLALNRFQRRAGWDARVYLAWARGASSRQIAELGAAGKLGTDAPFWWGYRTVARRIQAGGAAWREVLQEAGLRFDQD